MNKQAESNKVIAEIKASELEYLLLGKFPDGTIRQIIVGKDDVLIMLQLIGKIQAIDTPIQGIDFKKPKK